jgi:hypothetical protein
MTAKRHWPPADIERLKALYPDMPTAEVAAAFGCEVKHIYNAAYQHGLKKNAAFFESSAAGRLNGTTGADARFPKGHSPWNKGKRFEAGGRSAETRFKPNSKPHTWKPIGSERVADGYLQRKMTDTGYTPRDWVAVHNLIWQEHKGPIPKGSVVVFKDGNRTNFDIGNLECITRTELMRRNSIHNYPQEIVEVAQLRGAITRQINKRERETK